MLFGANKNDKWDKLYDTNKKTFFAKFEEKAINHYFANIFKKSILSISNIENGEILESGCGSGAISIMLSKHNNKITLLDLSANALLKAISTCKQSSIECKFTLGNMFSMPFKDNTFDLVFNQGVMEHFQLAGLNPAEGVKEMFRVVKKNGLLVILVPAYYSPLHVVYVFLKFFKLVDRLWPYEDQEFLHKRDLYKMMNEANCPSIKVKRVWSSLFFSLIGYCKKD